MRPVGHNALPADASIGLPRSGDERLDAPDWASMASRGGPGPVFQSGSKVIATPFMQ